MSFTATPIAEVSRVVAEARREFDRGITRPLAWRRATLRRLRGLVEQHEQRLLGALAADFGKPAIEAWVTEIGFVLTDIDHTLAHLDTWSRSRRVATPIAFQPGSSKLIREPLGVVCVIAPWNYPVQLLLLPMIGAIAAGNAVVGKPSELAPATSDALAALVAELGESSIAVVEGGVAETTALLEQRFDHILYTGNGRVARVVMRAAAEHLTPVTLELGGKSPAIVTSKAKIDVAARRIAWAKFLNAGQTCIAPDYVLVEPSVHDELVRELGTAIREFYGQDPATSPDLARIVNSAHFHRIEKLLDAGTVAHGGAVDADTRYIAPTVLTDVTRDDPVMGEEIFGPVLPVLRTDSIDAAIAFVNADEKPLALYVFTEDDDEAERVLASTSSGGACVNTALFHVSNPNLPFGGVGESGTGAYHGEFGFETFSHTRAVYQRSTKLDPPMLYPPFTPSKQKLLRRALTVADPRDRIAKARGRLRRR
jgi:aldehyde dehydrogenase (NAD+)